jgi:hypothetical protein
MINIKLILLSIAAIFICCIISCKESPTSETFSNLEAWEGKYNGTTVSFLSFYRDSTANSISKIILSDKVKLCDGNLHDSNYEFLGTFPIVNDTFIAKNQFKLSPTEKIEYTLKGVFFRDSIKGTMKYFYSGTCNGNVIFDQNQESLWTAKPN